MDALALIAVVVGALLLGVLVLLCWTGHRRTAQVSRSSGVIAACLPLA